MYIFVSFCYVIPVAYFGWFHNTIPRRHLGVSKKPFLVMGFLDALSAAMQVLASVYLPGTLLVLLPQAAIPLSMMASRLILRERFTRRQYVGAAVVFLGILVVLFPVLTRRGFLEYSCQSVEDENCALCEMETSEDECLSYVVDGDTALSIFTNISNNNNNDDDDVNQLTYCQWISRDDSLRKDDVLVLVWSLVMVASCVPMVFSSVYKQVALQVELDPILINGWVSLFQFMFGLPLAIPAGLASSPKVKPLELPQNWSHGIGCLFAQTNSVGQGCHPDDCSEAALWVHLFMLSSVVFTLSMMFVLKYGSSSLLYLGLTLMVPLGHLVFSLHSPSSVDIYDVLGLVVLVAGLVLYRFGHKGQVAPETNGPSTPIGGETGETANEEKDGFLEFLREPFMLMGDI
jgi:drug/metabolite transporter (DMT)-like permease